jgi:hypothetical protein
MTSFNKTNVSAFWEGGGDNLNATRRPYGNLIVLLPAVVSGKCRFQPVERGTDILRYMQVRKIQFHFNAQK